MTWGSHGPPWGRKEQLIRCLNCLIRRQNRWNNLKMTLNNYIRRCKNCLAPSEKQLRSATGPHLDNSCHNIVYCHFTRTWYVQFFQKTLVLLLSYVSYFPSCMILISLSFLLSSDSDLSSMQNYFFFIFYSKYKWLWPFEHVNVTQRNTVQILVCLQNPI